MFLSQLTLVYLIYSGVCFEAVPGFELLIELALLDKERTLLVLLVEESYKIIICCYNEAT